MMVDGMRVTLRCQTLTGNLTLGAWSPSSNLVFLNDGATVNMVDAQERAWCFGTAGAWANFMCAGLGNFEHGLLGLQQSCLPVLFGRKIRGRAYGRTWSSADNLCIDHEALSLCVS
jgi:hypothetical protein